MKGGFFMKKRIDTNNFVLEQSVLESDGDSTWIVTERDTKQIFYVHVSRNNRLYIKIFKGTHLKNISEAISALCDFLLQTGNPPTIRINNNVSLIILCKKSGFKNVKNIKHLFIYKKGQK